MSAISMPETPTFVGRQAILARLQQFLLAPKPLAHALCFVGAQGMGKTALLKHIARLDSEFVGVYIILNEVRLTSERDLLLHIVQRITATLPTAEINPARIPPIDHSVSDLRGWLRNIYLPEVVKLLRGRRLVLLWDDVHALTIAKDALRLPRDFSAFWCELLQTFPQIALIASADLFHEAALQQLAPLIHPADTERLTRLSAEDSAAMLHLFAPQASEAVQAQAYTLTGGSPRLLRRYCDGLCVDTTPEAAEEAVYAASREDFLRQWFRFSRDERIVLTAMAQLAHQTQSDVVTLDEVRAWLLESDYPLDSTTIHTALRGLEYAEVVQHSPQGMTWTSTLFYRWLLENARLEPDTPATAPSRRLLLLLGLLALGLLALGALLLAPQLPLVSPVAVPTATLGR